MSAASGSTASLSQRSARALPPISTGSPTIGPSVPPRRKISSESLKRSSRFQKSTIAIILTIAVSLIFAAPSAFSSASSSPYARIPTLNSPLFSLFGSFELKGRRRSMEDSHAALINKQLFLSILPFRSEFVEPGHLPMKAVLQNASLSLSSLSSSSWLYFGVFDGHGGPHTSEFIGARLLPAVAQKLEQIQDPLGSESDIRSALLEVFRSVDTASMIQEDERKTRTIEKIDSMNLDARTRSQKLKAAKQLEDGSTATLVALHRPSRTIITANAGDCRILMIGSDERFIIKPPSPAQRLGNRIKELFSQKGDGGDEKDGAKDSGDKKEIEIEVDPRLFDEKSDEINDQELERMVKQFEMPLEELDDKPVIALTRDHKPHLPIEKAHVEANEGFVTYRGVSRVNGILAISRAFGDFRLKPAVRVDPEVKLYTDRSKRLESGLVLKSVSQPRHDRFLLIGSDGLFDVFTNERLHYEVNRLFAEGHSLNDIAQIIAEGAYQMQSSDNVTLIIIDLLAAWM